MWRDRLEVVFLVTAGSDPAGCKTSFLGVSRSNIFEIKLGFSSTSSSSWSDIAAREASLRRRLRLDPYLTVLSELLRAGFGFGAPVDR